MNWDIEKSKLVYGISRDDLNFLDIDSQGELVININETSINIKEIIAKVKSELSPQNDFKVPSFTLRIPQLIGEQTSKIIASFNKVMDQNNYSGRFMPLYPIKVNHRKNEIFSVLENDDIYGFEVGTKAEMFLMIKHLSKQKHRILVCNGIKDKEYVNLIKNAILDNYNVFISIESLEELKLCIQHLPEDKLHLIIRIKPYIDVSGHWSETSGRNSKFGLSISDLLNIIEYFKAESKQELLMGIHAHPGSQITDLDSLTNYTKYLISTYIQLHEMGFKNIKITNFGGGLPVSYESDSLNILEEYANILVSSVKEACNAKHIPLPDIMIESGRIVTAQSSMVIVQILDNYNLFPDIGHKAKTKLEGIHANKEYKIEEIIQLWKDKQNQDIINKSFQEINDLEAESGYLKAILRKQLVKVKDLDKHILDPNVKEILSSNRFLLGNFSIFNSVIDHIMVGQYFPVFCIENLDKQPDTIVRLVDITCDSDGEISEFITKLSEEQLFTKDGYPLTSDKKFIIKGFPISNLENANNTYLAIPFVGAYQDIIEFYHNLIGDLSDITLTSDSSGNWEITISNHIQPVQKLLKDANYDFSVNQGSYIKQ